MGSRAPVFDHSAYTPLIKINMSLSSNIVGDQGLLPPLVELLKESNDIITLKLS